VLGRALTDAMNPEVNGFLASDFQE